MALKLDGRKCARALLSEIKIQFDQLQLSSNPKLCVVQIGDDPASSSYIKQKKKWAEEFKVQFDHQHLSSTSSKTQIAECIKKQVESKDIDGVLLQLPLDASEDLQTAKMTQFFLSLIPPEKDADGLHELNQGRLMARLSHANKWTSPLPCTALGICRLLEYYNIDVLSKKLCVVGRSRLVGLPTALLLAHQGATLNLCHRQTKNIQEHLKEAEIVVVAAGKKHLVKKSDLKSNCVLIDVGIHTNSDPETPSKLTGDIHPSCHPESLAYSPVPGGVGPMTVACLIENTFRLSAQKQGKVLPELTISA